MPGADHFLPVWLLHVFKEVYHTAIDAPNFLDIICDTDRRRFEVPETKLIKLETLLNWRENVPA